MHLVSQVVFNYGLYDNTTRIGEECSFNTLEELKLAIQNGKDYYKTPYKLNVSRTVQIIDTDNTTNRFGITTTPVILGKENVSLIVADKLMYPNDVRMMLMEKYGSLLNLNDCIGNEVKPVFFGGVNKETKVGLRKSTRLGINNINLNDSSVGNPTRYNLYHVNCHYLNNKDIVMNTNMKQIWPINTGIMPLELSQLLAKKKEKIYEG